ncbi:hypothetical protein KPL74_10010 [Bacillus sp. NP157]|nr:hypothetical protein KPL74_10010 [Bacillus sp. NP157]
MRRRVTFAVRPPAASDLVFKVAAIALFIVAAATLPTWPGWATALWAVVNAVEFIAMAVMKGMPVLRIARGNPPAP